MGGSRGRKPSEQQPSLGVGARLGLPLPPPVRGVVMRLPPPQMSLAGQVPLLSATPPPVEHAISVGVTQAGRVRISSLMDRGLSWRLDEPLTVTQIRLGDQESWLPALRIMPGGHSRVRVNGEHRITLMAPDRRYLGIEPDGSQVLTAMRLGEPTTVLVIGAPGVSMLLEGIWPREV